MTHYLTTTRQDYRRSEDVLWEDEENGAIVALAPELTSEVRGWIDHNSGCGADFATVAVTASLRHGPSHLLLQLYAPDLPGCGEVFVEAAPGGDLFVCWTDASGVEEQEVYSTTNDRWNPGGVEWVDVVPPRIANLLLGEEVAR